MTKEEFVIQAPNFFLEIGSCKGKKPRNNLATVNYLREIVSIIGFKYIGDTFNAFSDVNVSGLRGVPVHSGSQLNSLLIKLFQEQYPKMIDAYVDFYIKKRPFGTKVIYFLGDHKQTAAFTSNGIDEIKLKEVDTILNRKNKKGAVDTPNTADNVL